MVPRVNVLATENPVVFNGATIALFAVLGVVYVIVIGFGIATYWKLFTKAGRPGWHSLIPILNIYTLIKIAGRPGWWWVLALIPFVNIVVMILVMIDLAHAFGKDTGFAVGLILLSIVFLAILAFGDSQYLGPGQRQYAGYGYQPQGYQQSGYGQSEYGQQGYGAEAVGTTWGTTTTPAGWYSDPSGAGQRYWDGAQWTEHTAP